MRVYQIGLTLASGLLLVVAFQNCAKQGSLASNSTTSVDSTQMTQAMASLRNQISAASLTDLTCQADADCVALAVGSSHCGSPSFYVLNSKKSANFPDVLQLAAEFGDVERNYLSANQMVVSCEAKPVPRTSCVQNTCVTNR